MNSWKLFTIERLKFMVNIIEVEILYALPDSVFLKKIKIHKNATIEEAILHSQVMTRYPEIDLTRCKVGIFSKIFPLNHTLKANDRVEIYRPLQADPKQARLKRAQKQQQK